VEITIDTPALLFPAITLLMISYTTRFLHLPNLIRNLHVSKLGPSEHIVLKQIQNLRRRLRLIRNMPGPESQASFLCVICMFLLFSNQLHVAQACFAISLVFMIASLLLSLIEILDLSRCSKSATGWH
jgi:Protein of unknown function (DUF2721)